MHIIQDENGNPISHGHEHGHDHAYPNAHDHAPIKTTETKEQMTALLDYMLKHNQAHAAELDKMAGKLSGQGLTVAAQQVRKAAEEYTKGSLYLSLALSSVRDL